MSRLIGITDIRAVDENGRVLKSYITWDNMLKRCYSKEFHERQPTYIGTTICDKWLTYSNFKEWFDANFIEGHDMDKDVLQQGVENKIYSPATCLFVPSALNRFMSNHKSGNTSGYRGTCWKEQNKKYVAQINIYDHKTGTYKRKYLGLFTDPELAELVYDEAREIQASVWREIMMSMYNWSSEQANYIK